MNGARDELCIDCGQVFTIANKYSRANHRQFCYLQNAPHDSEEEIVAALGEDVLMVDPVDNGLVGEVNGVHAAMGMRCRGKMSRLEDFDHLNQFMATGRCACSDDELQLVKFLHMAHCGYGVSRAFSIGMLQYAKESGGKNVHLPDNWKRCVENTTRLIEKLEGERKTYTLDVEIPMDVRELLADPSQTHVGFEFECPVTEMIRVAMFSRTCKSWENVALTYEDNDGYLDDFCNGDRYKRIAANISPGGAILGAVLATDGICLDKCMFDSQEVCT